MPPELRLIQLTHCLSRFKGTFHDSTTGGAESSENNKRGLNGDVRTQLLFYKVIFRVNLFKACQGTLVVTVHDFVVKDTAPPRRNESREKLPSPSCRHIMYADEKAKMSVFTHKMTDTTVI